MSLKIDIKNIEGNLVRSIDLPINIFGKESNNDLISQYVRVYLTNQRVGNASTKTRGEVSGSGIKPFKQKGTGNARRGSLRTPLARKGGIVFGPKPRNFRLDMPKKMRVNALLTVLSTRYASNNLFILDTLGSDLKTKSVSDVLSKLSLLGSKTLIITADKDENVLKSSRNIDRVSVKMVRNLNAYDVLSHKNILFVDDSVAEIGKKYENK
jgi:large subunit ribosomal protein L4